jgi:hypothetical protein
MKFAKMYDNKRYGQIVVLRLQNQEGAPAIQFFCNPSDHGVCSFSIGWDNDDQAEKKCDTAFQEMTLQEIIEIIDGWMKHMEQNHEQSKAMH